MKFKKIYIEITNICNLNCSFCPPHQRQNEYMSFSNFKHILEQIKPYTRYIYLHVKGEPMLHPEFDSFVKYAYEQGFFVNITTNGTLLEKHLDSTKYIRQINISLHATNNEAIVENAKKISDCYVNFRVWNYHSGDLDSQERNATISLLQKSFDLDIAKIFEQKELEVSSSQTNFTLKDNFYISLQNEFKWPDISSHPEHTNGYCHATTDHIAILVDGTVIPCCLDNNGDINLGNIYKQNLEEILNSPRFLEMKNGFKNRVCVEELCKNCEYKNKF